MTRLVLVAPEEGGAPAPDPALARDFPAAYVRFIAGLGRANAGPDWWALTLAGRNPLSSRLPRRCFQFLSAVRAVEGGAATVAVSDPVVARQLEAWARGKGLAVENRVRARRDLKDLANRLLPSGPLWGFARALWRLLRARMTTRFVPDPGTRYRVIATLLNHQSFDARGRYRDTYFGELPRLMKEKGLPVLVFGSVTHRFERTIRDAAACSRAEGFPIVPMEAFLRPRDLIEPLAGALRRRLFGWPLQGRLELEGEDVGLLAREELAENFRESRFFHDLWYRACARALLGRVRAERLYYPFENRAWERMLLEPFRAARVPATGYQHATTTAFHLNLRLAPGEADLLPLPERIVTMGAVTLERLAERGFPGALLREGCALRQAPVGEPSRRPPGARRILVALASSVEEYRRVLRLLDGAFGADGPELKLRPHPVIPLEDGLAAAGPLRLRYEKDRAPGFEESMAEADAVFFASSTLGLEAVRRGIPAVFLDVGDFLKTDPMEGFSALKWSARTPEELRAVLGEIAGLPPEELERRRKDARAYAERYCREPDAERLAAF